MSWEKTLVASTMHYRTNVPGYTVLIAAPDLRQTVRALRAMADAMNVVSRSYMGSTTMFEEASAHRGAEALLYVLMTG